MKRKREAFQVSPSCNSIFVDGSESRGALKAAIEVTYGAFQGLVELTVWTPKLPLNVVVEDNRLSKIRGWSSCQSDNSPLRAFSKHKPTRYYRLDRSF